MLSMCRSVGDTKFGDKSGAESPKKSLGRYPNGPPNTRIEKKKNGGVKTIQVTPAPDDDEETD
eukprot:COSAG06_NODE_11041_length_1577_cov_2.134641_2_plen_63_part_00